MAAVLETQDLTYVYSPGSPFARTAVDHVNLSIEEGEFVGVIGHTGSGKSTLIQQLNGLLRPTSGKILLHGKDIWAEPKKIRAVRFQVGMVFQYPEYQLFADTVYNDVAFGPKNLKLPQEEIDERVREALALVGMDFEYVSQKSPFELSGGEKRRVAIAGVIAMRPKILVLDEPTAGLDPQGKKEILDLVTKLWKTSTPTIVMISHDMNEVAKYATRVAVFDMGRVVYAEPPQKLFERQDELIKMGLDVPTLAKLRNYLVSRGVDVPSDCLTVDKMAEILAKLKNGGEVCSET